MGPNLYTQTPGALHMGGGYANPFEARDSFLGNIYGPSSRGDSFGRFGAGLPGHALTLGTAASMASGFGLGGKMMAGVGNTLGMGAMSMGPQILATAAMQYAAGQFSRGQQQNQISQNLSQRVFGERDVGGRMGMGASRDAIGGLSSAFRKLANSSEMLTNDQELKTVLDKFTDMKLLDTSKNLTQMASRVTKMSKTLREISMDLGTTLEGALPDFQRHAQMGFMDPDQMRQSIRTNRALRGVGISMNDSTIQSFEMAQASTNFAMGGDKRIGALGAQRTLGNLSVATSMGLLSDRDLMAATGKRGEDAVADLAQQSMQASSALMQSGHGRMLAAALGEVGEDGKFTGGIDAKVKRRLKSMSMEDVGALANKKLSAEGGTASFERRMRSGMGANMGASMDMSEFSSVLDKVFDNEDTMAIVLQQLTGMRGQTLDVLLAIQEDGDKIVNETKRRSQELSRRNRINAVVQREFTLSGRLDTAYRDYFQEPVSQNLQRIGSNVGTSFGKYGDNFGSQILKHGIMTGTGRAIFGLGMNEGGAEQSYEDRTRNMRTAREDMFGAGTGMTRTQGLTAGGIIRSTALGVASIATMNPYLATATGASVGNNIDSYMHGGQRRTLFGSKRQHTQKILAASGDLQERESEVGVNSTTFGNTDKGFLDAYTGRRRDIEFSQEEKSALLRGTVAAFGQGDDLENMTEEFAKSAFEWSGAFSDKRGMSLRKKMEATGGQYGALKQLMNDKSLTPVQRRTVRAVVERMESQLRNKVTLDTEEDVIAELNSNRSDVEDMFEKETDGESQLEAEWLSSSIDHIEDDYLKSVVGGGELNKLQAYIEGLADPAVLRKLTAHGSFGLNMDAKGAVKVAKDIFGVEINEAEGESAKDLFIMLAKRLAGTTVEAFAERMQPMSKKLNKKIRAIKNAEANNRKLALKKQLNTSTGLSDTLRSDLTTAFDDTSMGKAGGGASLFDLAHTMSEEELASVKGELGEALTKTKAMSTDEDALRKEVRGFYGDAHTESEYDNMGLDELKELGVQANLISSSPLSANTETGQALQQLSPAENAKIVADLGNNVAANMEVITSAALRYQRATTDNIKELKK